MLYNSSIAEVIPLCIELFQKVSVLVSVLTLTTIGIERYLGICHPMSDFLPWIKTRVALLVIWIVAMVTAIPDVYYMTVIPDDVIPPTINLLKSCRSADNEAERTQQLVIFAFFFIIPLVIMSFAYSSIFICLWRSTQNLPNISKKYDSSFSNVLHTYTFYIVLQQYHHFSIF